MQPAANPRDPSDPTEALALAAALHRLLDNAAVPADRRYYAHELGIVYRRLSWIYSCIGDGFSPERWTSTVRLNPGPDRQPGSRDDGYGWSEAD